jgi:hypothetical protein
MADGLKIVGMPDDLIRIEAKEKRLRNRGTTRSYLKI